MASRFGALFEFTTNFGCFEIRRKSSMFSKLELIITSVSCEGYFVMNSSNELTCCKDMSVTMITKVGIVEIYFENFTCNGGIYLHYKN